MRTIKNKYSTNRFSNSTEKSRTKTSRMKKRIFALFYAISRNFDPSVIGSFILISFEFFQMLFLHFHPSVLFFSLGILLHSSAYSGKAPLLHTISPYFLIIFSLSVTCLSALEIYT